MGITMMPRLFAGAPEAYIPRSTSKSAIPHVILKKKISEVSGVGKYFRHPDSLHASYADVTQGQEALGTLPEGVDYNIAIVGGGPSGIASLHELSKVARARKSGKIHVKLYEPDPNHFSFCEFGVCSSLNSLKVDTKCKRAGRVFAARSKGDVIKEDHAVYEIGAMRFPETAGLTWKYAQAVFGEDAIISEFPNPGTVPTEFVFGDRVDRYTRNDWLNEDSPTKLVSKWVNDALIGNPYKDKKGNPLPDVCLDEFKINGKDAAKFGEDLKAEKISNLEEMQRAWKEYVTRHDNLSLGSAVTKVLKTKLAEMKKLKIEGLESDEEKLQYCVQLFGCFGFGTGGVRSEFSTSVLETIRLSLWSYDYEFSLPVKENVEFIRGLFRISHCNNENFEVEVVRGRVCDVCHTGDNARLKKALVFYYRSERGEEDNRLLHDEFDYVILAVPPHQMSSITRRAGFSGRAHNVKIGDYTRQADKAISVRPALMLSDKFESVNVNIFTAIDQVNMCGSSKVWGTIRADVFNRFARDFHGQKIKAVVSDCGLGSSYIVPSSLGDKSDPKYYGFLISYAWDDDSRKLQHKFKAYPINHAGKSKPKKHEHMITSIINHTVREVRDPEDGEYKRWWFGQLMADDEHQKHLTQTLSYDWTTSYTSGAFKMDLPGGHYNAHLCFRYHTHALDGELDNRFFLAGDSVSHIGGWLEGAFMSSMNAVTGLIVAANGGGQKGVDALVPKARPIIEGLEPVVKNRSTRKI